MPYNLRLGHGRVGDEANPSATLGAKPGERITRLVKGPSSIMDDAPYIAEDDVILACNVCETAREMGICHAAGLIVPVTGVNAPLCVSRAARDD